MIAGHESKGTGERKHESGVSSETPSEGICLKTLTRDCRFGKRTSCGHSSTMEFSPPFRPLPSTRFGDVMRLRNRVANLNSGRAPMRLANSIAEVTLRDRCKRRFAQNCRCTGDRVPIWPHGSASWVPKNIRQEAPQSQVSERTPSEGRRSLRSNAPPTWLTSPKKRTCSSDQVDTRRSGTQFPSSLPAPMHPPIHAGTLPIHAGRGVVAPAIQARYHGL